MYLYPLFFLFSLGQLGRISFLTQEVNINLFDVYIVGMLGWWLFRYKLAPIKKSFQNVKVLYGFAAWLILTYSISLIQYSPFENLIALLYLLRLICYLAFFLYLGYSITKEKNLQNNVKKAVTMFSGIVVTSSVLQYFLYPNLRNLSYLGWDPHQGRIFSTFLDTSATAAVFGLILLYFILHKKSISPLLRIFFLIANLALGLLTYSRSFYVSIFLTSTLYFLTKKSYLILLTILACFALLVFVLPRQFGEGTNLLRTFSIESRMKDEGEALRITSKNPLFGIGYNHLRYTKDNNNQILDQQKSHSEASFHSSFLIILATSGIIGFVLFIALLLKFSRVNEISRYYVVFLSIFSLFDNILLYPVVTLIFLSLLALELGSEKKSIFRT